MTCLGCGHRSPTWEAFKAHRRTCAGHLWQGPQTPPAPVLTDDDLDRLAALYEQLAAEEEA